MHGILKNASFFSLDISYRLEENLPAGCGFCHIPYDELNMPFPAHLTYCYNCRKQKVPDVLFTTIDLPIDATVIGKGCLIQARYICANCIWGLWKCMEYGVRSVFYMSSMLFPTGVILGRLGNDTRILYLFNHMENWEKEYPLYKTKISLYVKTILNI